MVCHLSVHDAKNKANRVSAELKCKVCAQSFTMEKPSRMTAAVDVFQAWFDATVKLNDQKAAANAKETAFVEESAEGWPADEEQHEDFEQKGAEQELENQEELESQEGDEV